VLEVELLNDAPEKNLDGTVGIHQGDKEWTSEVTWYYTGYGEAAILVDTINENQSFRITYNEKNPKATYLDRTIEWYEVQGSLTIIFMETSELTITQITFDDSAETIVVSVTNSGTSATAISLVRVNGAIESSVTGTTSYAAGASGTFTITITDVVAGNKYSVSLFTSDGTLVGSYTDTA
jgi:hypothetical protein